MDIRTLRQVHYQGISYITWVYRHQGWPQTNVRCTIKKYLDEACLVAVPAKVKFYHERRRIQLQQ